MYVCSGWRQPEATYREHDLLACLVKTCISPDLTDPAAAPISHFTAGASWQGPAEGAVDTFLYQGRLGEKLKSDVVLGEAQWGSLGSCSSLPSMASANLAQPGKVVNTN